MRHGDLRGALVAGLRTFSDLKPGAGRIVYLVLLAVLAVTFGVSARRRADQSETA